MDSGINSDGDERYYNGIKADGRKTTAIYLASIMGYSLIMGMVTKWLYYGILVFDITVWGSQI